MYDSEERNPERRLRICREIRAERSAQDAKFGEQNHKDGTSVRNKEIADWARKQCDADFHRGHGSWADILNEEFWEAMAEEDPVKLRKELIQVAAVCVGWIEAIDRRRNE